MPRSGKPMSQHDLDQLRAQATFANIQSHHAEVRLDLENMWLEFKPWFLHEEGGQKKHTRDGRKVYSKTSERNQELYDFCSKVHSWKDTHWQEVWTNHEKMTAWRVTQQTAMRRASREAPAGGQWLQVSGPLGILHDEFTSGLYQPGHALMPGPRITGGALGRGTHMYSRLLNGKGYYLSHALTQAELSSVLTPCKKTESFLMTVQIEEKLDHLDGALFFAEEIQLSIAHSGEKTKAWLSKEHSPRQRVDLVSPQHAMATRNYRLSTTLMDAENAAMCLSKLDFQHIISTDVILAINHANAGNPSGLPLLDVQHVQRTCVEAYQKIGCTVQVQCDNIQEAHNRRHVPATLQKLRAAYPPAEGAAQRQSAPKERKGLTWVGWRWNREHGEGEVIDDVLRKGHMFVSRAPLPTHPPQAGCLHAHHRHVMLTDTYIREGTDTPEEFFCPGAIIMPHPNTLIELLKLEELCFRLAQITEHSYGLLWPAEPGSPIIKKVSLERKVCSRLEVDLSCMDTKDVDRVFARVKGAPIHDVWALPIELLNQLELHDTVLALDEAAHDAKRPKINLTNLAEFANEGAHHEETLDEADEIPLFLSAVVALTDEPATEGIRVWPYSHDAVMYMHRALKADPDLASYTQHEVADYLQLHAPETSNVANGISIRPTDICIPRASSLLYLPSMVQAQCGWQFSDQRLIYRMGIQVIRPQCTNLVLPPAHHALHVFLMRCCDTLQA